MLPPICVTASSILANFSSKVLTSSLGVKYQLIRVMSSNYSGETIYPTRYVGIYCLLIKATSTSCSLTICDSKKKATFSLCIFSCNASMLPSLSSSHIPAIPGDVSEIYSTPQSKFNIFVRFGILFSYLMPLFSTFHTEAWHVRPVTSSPSVTASEAPKQHIGSSLTIIPRIAISDSTGLILHRMFLRTLV